MFVSYDSLYNALVNLFGGYYAAMVVGFLCCVQVVQVVFVSYQISGGHSHAKDFLLPPGMINAGMSCQLIHYMHEEHDKFFELCKNFDFVIVRCNPGQIKADGGDQAKFDDGMRGLRKLGKQVWPSPDVMEKMGAKDALCKVRGVMTFCHTQKFQGSHSARIYLYVYVSWTTLDLTHQL